MSDIKRAVVIGCGGVAGGAWSCAMLSELQKQLNWDTREAEVLIGTSAGAVLASLLGGGVSVERLIESQQKGNLDGCSWDHQTATGAALPPVPEFKFSSFSLFKKGLLGKVSGLTAISGLLPNGSSDMQTFMNLSSELANEQGWVNHKNTWLIAVDVQTGQRVAFGSESAPKAILGDAMCASYGVPGWCPPVIIQNKTYIDGGVASPCSADLLINRKDIDEVIIVAPMASTFVDKPVSPLAKVERRARAYMTAIVDKEVAQLQAAGKRVIRIEPGPHDLEAFGYNMMDPSRRQQVFNTAMQTAGNTVEQALKAARSY